MGRLAVDIGGTFVDAVYFDSRSNAISLEKVSTTPDDPTIGTKEAIDRIGTDLSVVDAFVHGTTLGLNAILEHNGATTGIITNEGFIDVFEIGRLDRPPDEMFNPMYEKPDPLVPRYQRAGVSGRMDSDGTVIEPLDDDSVRTAADHLIADHSVESIAICLLHSYRNPAHENRIAELIQADHPDLNISISSDLTREYREYERTCTAVMDAYIKPLLASYLDELETELAEGDSEGSFFVTRSGGGALSAEKARETPIHTVLSGPAGGLIGASLIGQSIGKNDLIAADIGGTSTDTCVIRDGAPIIEHESSIGQYPVLIPSYDIRTIGSGGGSIAWLDGELLKVGPQSAGADPGPICYGRGGSQPTVTDAAVMLGYIGTDAFLGGELSLDEESAESGIRRQLAEPLDASIEEVCQGIFDVQTAAIVNAISEITVERGIDPREFDIVAYGGAGPMLMPFVARELDVEFIVVPPAPSVFSAWGMLLADVVYDVSQTTVADLRSTDIDALESALASLEAEAADTLADEGFQADSQRFQRSFEMRYIGQEHTVEVPADNVKSVAELQTRFQDRHEARYGHQTDDAAEIVHLRVRAAGKTDKPGMKQLRAIGDDNHGNEIHETVEGSKSAYCVAEDAFVDFAVRDRRSLSEGELVPGPAIVQEETTSILVFSDQHAELDDFGNVIISGG